MIVINMQLQVDIEIEGRGIIKKGFVLPVHPHVTEDGKLSLDHTWVAFHHYGWLEVPAKIFMLEAKIEEEPCH